MKRAVARIAHPGLWLLAALAFLPGCTALPWSTPAPVQTDGGALPAARHTRSAGVDHDMQQERDVAELRAAQTRFDEGDLTGCRQILAGVVERRPQNRPARLLLAETYLAGNEPKEAQTLLEATLKENPNDAEVHHMLGLTLDVQGRSTEAKQHYARAAELAPANDAFQVSYQSAIRPVAPATAVAPPRREAQSPQPQPPQALTPPPLTPSPLAAHASAGELAGEALAAPEAPLPPPRRSAAVMPVSYVEPVSADCPVTPGPSPARGEGRDYSAALPHPPAAVPEKPAKTVQFDRAECTAGADAAQAARIRAALGRAETALAAARCDDALAALREARAVRPDNPQIPVSTAVTLLRAEQAELALRLLREAAGHFPDSAPFQRTLGAACYAQGDYRPAQVALERAVSLDKSHALSYFLLGCSLAKLGQPDAAAANFRQARLIDARYAAPR